MSDFAHHPERRRHFLRRLEAFGDIVYGFSLSQVAVGVDAHTLMDAVQNPHLATFTPLIAAALTFVVLCLSWLAYHRTFASVFVGENIDVAIHFVILGTVALLPLMLRVYVEHVTSAVGVIAYAALFGTSVTLVAVLTARGYQRFAASMEPDERLRVFRRLVRLATIGLVFLATLPLLARFGPLGTIAWTPTWIAMLGTRLIRTAPIPGARSAPDVGTVRF